jgi:hypothetical protein
MVPEGQCAVASGPARRRAARYRAVPLVGLFVRGMVVLLNGLAA